MNITATGPRLRFARLTEAIREGFGRATQACAVLFRAQPGLNWEPEPAANPWQQYWGHPYGPGLKRWLLAPLFEQLEEEGKIGELVLDVGSGACAVSALLKGRMEGRVGRKRILIDIAADNSGGAEGQKIRLDVEKISSRHSLAYLKAWVRACRYLGRDPRREAGEGGVDTMIFSDILNYVDFEEVLRGFARYLKPGGRIIVNNLPMRGNEALFSEKGLKDNRRLYEVLERERFEIESKAFPCRHRGVTDESEELIVLVARKRQSAG